MLAIYIILGILTVIVSFGLFLEIKSDSMFSDGQVDEHEDDSENDGGDVK